METKRFALYMFIYIYIMGVAYVVIVDGSRER